MSSKTDFLVIGSGIAGLTFAVKTAERFPDRKVTIITKADEDESNTKYAQGGVAAVWNMSTDSLDKHIADTLDAGDGLCNLEVVKAVVTEGPLRIREIIEWGTQFDKDETGEYHLGKEGGHTAHRVLHHKDATGKEIERALLAQAHALPNIELFTHHFVIDKPSTQANPELDPHWSDKIGHSSVEFIRKNAGNPFFLYMAFSAIHDPLIEKADSIEKWRKHPDSALPENNPIIGTMLARLDKNVGKVLDVLDELKLTEKTMVIFYSDNGGLARNNVVYFMDFYPEGEKLRIAKQTPFREGKGWLYEGGIRVPLVIRWPGVVNKGSVSHEVVSSYDFMPTFCDLLGVSEPPDMDGASLLPYLKTGNDFPQRSHFWNFPHYHNGPPCAVIRNGKWKLIEWYEPSLTGKTDTAYELYDLENDPGETTNLAGTHKSKTIALAGELQKWREDVGAQVPVVNEKFEGSEN